MGLQELHNKKSFSGVTWRFLVVVIAFLVICMLIISIALIVGGDGDKPVIKDMPVKPISAKDEVLNSLKFDYQWRKAGFGNVMEADFTINNQSNYDIRDIKIICQLYGKSGTRIDEVKAIVYDMVKKKSKKKINDFNMGFIHNQTSNAACEVMDFKIEW